MTASPTTQTPALSAPAHTPTPWKLHEVLASSPTACGVLNIRSGKVNVLGLTNRHGSRDDADAALIVEAVNSHAGLVARVAELEAALAMMIAMADAKVSPSWEKVKQARAALARK
jgi:hypothetical protein